MGIFNFSINRNHISQIMVVNLKTIIATQTLIHPYDADIEEGTIWEKGH